MDVKIGIMLHKRGRLLIQATDNQTKQTFVIDLILTAVLNFKVTNTRNTSLQNTEQTTKLFFAKFPWERATG